MNLFTSPSIVEFMAFYETIKIHNGFFANAAPTV